MGWVRWVHGVVIGRWGNELVALVSVSSVLYLWAVKDQIESFGFFYTIKVFP
jgi:hypothetical protein